MVYYNARHGVARGSFVGVARFSRRWIGGGSGQTTRRFAHAAVDRCRDASRRDSGESYEEFLTKLAKAVEPRQVRTRPFFFRLLDSARPSTLGATLSLVEGSG